MLTPKPRPRGAEATAQGGAYGSDENRETLERMRRLETRVTNTLRSLGVMPNAHAPDARNGVVTYTDALENGERVRYLHVSSPNVAIAEISRVAVMHAPHGCDTTMHIVLCNQPWGQMVVRGQPHNPQGTAS